jgi:fibronectin type 3 domain-containing protein
MKNIISITLAYLILSLSTCSLPLEGIGVKPRVPEKPELTAGKGSIVVSWKTDSLAEAYNIRYGASTNISEAEIKTVNSSPVTITGLINDTTYYVWMQAANARGSSDLSEMAQITLSLGTPEQPGLAARPGSISVTWTDVTLAETYRVFYGTSIDRTDAASITVNATSTIITGLINDTTYYVWVQAINAGGSSTVSEMAQMTLSLGTPEQASVSAGSGSLTVAWANVALAETYKVFYGITTNVSDTTVITVTDTSTTITGLTNYITYYVWIQAVNAGGSSGISAIASATTSLDSPAVPANVSALSASATSITVSWEASANATSGYRIYRSTSAEGPYEEKGTSMSTSYTDTGLISGSIYYYKVSAHNLSGASNLSVKAFGVAATFGSLSARLTGKSIAGGSSHWYIKSVTPSSDWWLEWKSAPIVRTYANIYVTAWDSSGNELWTLHNPRTVNGVYRGDIFTLRSENVYIRVDSISTSTLSYEIRYCN